MSKDTFWTVPYKGHYIHGHYDRELRREVIRIQIMKSDGGFTTYSARTLQAAKYRISRFHGAV